MLAISWNKKKKLKFCFVLVNVIISGKAIYFYSLVWANCNNPP